MKNRRLVFPVYEMNDRTPFLSLFDNNAIRIGLKEKFKFNKGDVLFLEGGVDINPSLYGEKPHPKTQQTHHARDHVEITLAMMALEAGIPIVGICRGAQLLNVLNGGKLVQHMTPETHNSSRHLLSFSGTTDAEILTICDHHQAMIPPKSAKVIARAHYDDCPEIVLFPKTKSLAIQGHPAWGMRNEEISPFTQICIDLVKDLMEQTAS